MGFFQSRIYSDEELAKLEKLKSTELLTLNVKGSLVCSMFQEHFQRDPTVDELDDIIYYISDSGLRNDVSKYIEDCISVIITDQSIWQRS